MLDRIRLISVQYTRRGTPMKKVSNNRTSVMIGSYTAASVGLTDAGESYLFLGSGQR